MYCKVSVRNLTKRTNVVPLRLKGCHWNQTKHLPTNVCCFFFAVNTFTRLTMPVKVVRSRKHPFNLVRIQLFAFDSTMPKQHELIGTVAFHLHDIIKVSCHFLFFPYTYVASFFIVLTTVLFMHMVVQVTKVEGTFDLFDNHVFVGEMDLDVAFCYGVFGYGYSSQVSACFPFFVILPV